MASNLIGTASNLLARASNLQPSSDGLQPNSDGLQLNSDGLQPNSNGLQPNSNGLQPTSDGLQPNIDGIQPNSDGLQPTSDGLQPTSDGLQTRDGHLCLSGSRDVKGHLCLCCFHLACGKQDWAEEDVLPMGVRIAGKEESVVGKLKPKQVRMSWQWMKSSKDVRQNSSNLSVPGLKTE